MIHMALYVCGLCECMRTCGRAHVGSGHSPHIAVYIGFPWRPASHHCSRGL